MRPPCTLASLIRETNATFLINAAGFTGKPNVDACELQKHQCLLGNSVLPGIIREACELCERPWGHVSSGCIYAGRRSDGSGFSEVDAPNFCFRSGNCSFYSGSKALGEECLQNAQNTFLWRLRMPFNHIDSQRNYISKVLNYSRLLQAENSLSHLNEFVNACLQYWRLRVPYGTYNVTNTGSTTTSRVAELIRAYLFPERTFSYFHSEDEFLQLAAKTPRSNCVLDNSKLLGTGISMSHVEDAIVRSLENWVPASGISTAFGT